VKHDISHWGKIYAGKFENRVPRKIFVTRVKAEWELGETVL
jgi:hypothetical protein